MGLIDDKANRTEIKDLNIKDLDNVVHRLIYGD